MEISRSKKIGNAVRLESWEEIVETIVGDLVRPTWMHAN